MRVSARIRGQVGGIQQVFRQGYLPISTEDKVRYKKTKPLEQP